MGFPVRVIAMSDIWDRKDEQLIFFLGRAAAHRPAIAAVLQDLCIVTMTLNDFKVWRLRGFSGLQLGSAIQDRASAMEL
jgi:hypothetical protein